MAYGQAVELEAKLSMVEDSPQKSKECAELQRALVPPDWALQLRNRLYNVIYVLYAT